jgi:hypothetical protein
MEGVKSGWDVLSVTVQHTAEKAVEFSLKTAADLSDITVQEKDHNSSDEQNKS